MVTLTVVAEPAIARTLAGAGRYTEEISRALIATAPAGCDVELLIATHRGDRVNELRDRLPGARITTASLRTKELSRAWQYGVPVAVTRGLVHAPTLLAPLFKHDRASDGGQVVVSVHDVSAWVAPDSIGTRESMWQKAMVKRARKHADAIVVPTHAVAGELANIADFGDRIRVISGAPASALRLPATADERAARLGLPERFVATVASLEPRKGLRALIKAMADPTVHDVPLLIAGPDNYRDQRISDAAMAAGLPEGRVRALGSLSDSDLAVFLDRASVFVYPSLSSGFGLPIVEAFRFGTPVVHSDAPSLVEVAGDAGISVERADADKYPKRLAEAIASVLDDSEIAARQSVFAIDRARAFSWRDSAERIWQLHADL